MLSINAPVKEVGLFGILFSRDRPKPSPTLKALDGVRSSPLVASLILPT